MAGSSTRAICAGKKSLAPLSKKPPLVSVVLPTFNRGWTVKEAVDSVLGQTLDAFELIVVDDGSTDNTAALLAPYGDLVRVIRQENKGVSAARNRGAAAGRGRYLAFLDSDDLWLPDKLAVQVKFFRDHPNARICQTGEIWIRKGRRVNPGLRHQKVSGDIFLPSLRLCLVSPSAVMMTRELFEAHGGFDETFFACEDYDLWLRIGLANPVYLLKPALVVKRGGHSDQLSANPGLDKYRIRSLVKLLEAGGLTRARRTAVLEVLAEKCEIYAAGCEKRGRRKEAARFRGLLARYAGVADFVKSATKF